MGGWGAVRRLAAVVVSGLMVAGAAQAQTFEERLNFDHTNANRQAMSEYRSGHYTAATEIAKLALARAEAALGREHPDVGILLNNLAAFYRARGRDGEAEPALRRSLAIFEKALPPEHPAVAKALSHLAGVYQAQGRYGEAEPLFRRGLAICEKVLGPERPDVPRTRNLQNMANALNQLAGLYQAQGRYGEAEPLFRRSLALFEKNNEANEIMALGDLGWLASARSDWAQAADYWQRSTRDIARRATKAGDYPEVGEAQRLSWHFAGLIKATHRLAIEGRAPSDCKRVTRLYRNEDIPDDHCWLRAPGWCLAYD